MYHIISVMLQHANDYYRNVLTIGWRMLLGWVGLNCSEEVAEVYWLIYCCKEIAESYLACTRLSGRMTVVCVSEVNGCVFLPPICSNSYMHDCQMELFLQPIETGMSLVMPHIYVPYLLTIFY